MYHKCRLIKDSLVSSPFSENTTVTPLAGTFPCGHCSACTFFDTRSEVTLPRGVHWQSKHHVTCQTEGLIYLLTFPSGAYYVGKTKRQLSIRILEHVHAAQTGFFKSIIGRHVTLDHDYSFEGLSFLPLAIMTKSARGGDWDKQLLQVETKWIFKLQAHTSPSLNDSISYAPFL